MALRPSRRSVLRWCGVAGVVALGGCAGDRPATSPDDDPTPTTEDAGSGGPTPDQFAFSAGVASQASTEAPAALWVELTNEGDRAARVGTGPVLASDLVFGTEEFVLLPDTYVGPNDDGVEHTGDCWRYVDEHGPYVQSVLKWHDLVPDESVSAGFGVHTRGADRTCLPAGTSRLPAEVLLGDEGTELDLALVLTVDEERRVSVEAEGPG